jgi:Na+/proline symporter
VLGALLYLYSTNRGLPLPEFSDELFPRLALNELGLAVGVFFLLGITASSYASADSALAGLTTSFCIDFLNFENKEEKQKSRQKLLVHIGFSLVFLIVILVFKEINERSVVDAVLNVAGYTYGPLLGLFFFGIFTRYQVRDRLVPVVCVLSPLISYWISSNSAEFFPWYGGMGIEVLILNGVITFAGLFLVSLGIKSSEQRV